MKILRNWIKTKEQISKLILKVCVSKLLKNGTIVIECEYMTTFTEYEVLLKLFVIE